MQPASDRSVCSPQDVESAAASKVKIEALHPLFAARVQGLDLRRPLSDAQVTALHDAMNQHAVLVLPGQDIADDVLFLARHRASNVTGDEILVEGGFDQAMMELAPRPGF